MLNGMEFICRVLSLIHVTLNEVVVIAENSYVNLGRKKAHVVWNLNFQSFG